MLATVLFFGISNQALACSMLQSGFDQLQYKAVLEAVYNTEDQLESILSIVQKETFKFEVTMSDANSPTGKKISVYTISDKGDMCPELEATKAN